MAHSANEPAGVSTSFTSASETAVALLGIIVQNPESVEKLNGLLHEQRAYIIGRMGVPPRERGLSIISIAIDAPKDVISALAGQIGRLEGVSCKTVYPRTFE